MSQESESSRARHYRAKVVERWSAAMAKARPHFRDQFVDRMAKLFDRSHLEGLADPDFAQQIAEGNELTHQQRLAEMLLADHLWTAGFALRSSAVGPDFHATRDGRSAWIELITPEPVGIDKDWLQGGEGAWEFPHEQICLRLTSAIKEKHEKLAGNPGRGTKGYLAKGICGPSDPYVIAVNQHLLQRHFRSHNGISGIPAACEVLFAVGPWQLHLDPGSGAVVGQDHQHRPVIKNARRAAVPTDNFFDPAYANVSAVLALDLVIDPYITPDPDTPLLREHLSAAIYNPLASNPLPQSFLPAQSQWHATLGEQEYSVSKD